MAFQLWADVALAPYQGDSRNKGVAGTIRFLIEVEDVSGLQPLQLFNIRPYSVFNPVVGGVGNQAWFHNFRPIYRRHERFDIGFFGAPGLQIFRTGVKAPDTARIRVFWEQLG